MIRTPGNRLPSETTPEPRGKAIPRPYGAGNPSCILGSAPAVVPDRFRREGHDLAIRRILARQQLFEPYRESKLRRPRVVSSVILGRWLGKIGSTLVRVIDVTVRRSG